MMKNKSQYSVAVRRPDGEIEVKTDEYVGIAGDKAWAKLPLIRGMVNFIDSLILGMKTLSWSASFYEDEEEEAKPGKFEKFLLKLFGEKAEKVVMGADRGIFCDHGSADLYAASLLRCPDFFGNLSYPIHCWPLWKAVSAWESSFSMWH